jgi:hypothetical protein
MIKLKIVVNFKPYDLEPKIVQNRVLKLQKSPDYGRVQKQFRDSESWWCGWLKLLPYEINSAKPRIWRLMSLSRSHHEGSGGFEEPLDPRVLIRWPRWSLQYYILTGNPIFWRHHQELRNCIPLGCHIQGGLLYSTKKGQGRRRTKGRCSPLGRLPPGRPTLPPCTAAAAPSPRRGSCLSHLRRHISIIIYRTSSSSPL